MKCRYCGEEMIENELVDLGYGKRNVVYDCPNNCEFIKWLEEQNKLNKLYVKSQD